MSDAKKRYQIKNYLSKYMKNSDVSRTDISSSSTSLTTPMTVPSAEGKHDAFLSNPVNEQPAPTVLQFAPWSSFVHASFWASLANLKVDHLHLDAGAKEIHASIALDGSNRVSLNASSLTPDVLAPDTASLSTSSIAVKEELSISGILLNSNTAEDFKFLNKSKLLSDLGMVIWDDMIAEEGLNLKNLNAINQFQLITFADLKRYRFTFWFAFPVLIPEEPFLLSKAPMNLSSFFTTKDILSSAWQEITRYLSTPEGKVQPLFRLRQVVSGNSFISLVAEAIDMSFDLQITDPKDFILIFQDSSAIPHIPGWGLRNYLFLLKHKWHLSSIRILCHRRDSLEESFVLSVELPGPLSTRDTVKCVGWEKNQDSKLSPRIADLGPLMDPLQLASNAVDLNLKLMRWRIMPSLDLQAIFGKKCLILGGGTLGTNIARLLLSWGVRNITIVDNGRVSFSNPVRQPLFEYEDCLKGGKFKAEAAADALRRIFPGVNAKAVVLSIPMPGHALEKASPSSVLELDGLIQAADAIFLGTDSRESRWLPTVLASYHEKLLINAALGFDSYLVMRHGVGAQPISVTKSPDSLKSMPIISSVSASTKLGCYFCSDVVAPMDSLTGRTLDQQCTVTRPGLSAIASGLAVELLISIINHPDGQLAPADWARDITEPTDHPLGLVPHQIRGYLTHFGNILCSSQAYDKCSACSFNIMNGYRTGGISFLLECLKSPKYIEDVTGLTAMFETTKLDDIGMWDNEEDVEIDDENPSLSS